MERERLSSVRSGLLRRASRVMSEKEEEYNSTDDVLSNLRKIAHFRNCTIQQAIMNLVSKQMVALSEDVDREASGLADIPLEIWEEKVVDTFNYLIKLFASLVEDTGE